MKIKEKEEKYRMVLRGDLARIFLKYCRNGCKNKAQVVRRAIREYLIKEKVLEKE